MVPMHQTHEAGLVQARPGGGGGPASRRAPGCRRQAACWGARVSAPRRLHRLQVRYDSAQVYWWPRSNHISRQIFPESTHLQCTTLLTVDLKSGRVRAARRRLRRPRRHAEQRAAGGAPQPRVVVAPDRRRPRRWCATRTAGTASASPALPCSGGASTRAAPTPCSGARGRWGGGQACSARGPRCSEGQPMLAPLAAARPAAGRWGGDASSRRPQSTATRSDAAAARL